MELTLSKNKEDSYPGIFEDVFGCKPKSIPENVFIAGNNGDIIGFVSGHKNFDSMFYIEYAGILPKFQKGPYLRHLAWILDEIGDGFITAVDNKNVMVMKILLSIGFIPIGFRSAEDHSYVEWMRGKNG